MELEVVIEAYRSWNFEMEGIVLMDNDIRCTARSWLWLDHSIKSQAWIWVNIY
jgi:hypothetical protein